jgi:hypothetical protein
MFYHTEAKPQTWRALAIFEDGSECLIFLGRSTTQVRAGYRAAYLEVLDGEERAQVQRISLQCWDGTPDCGRWVPKTTLAVPDREKAAPVGAGHHPAQAAFAPEAEADDEADAESPSVLPFQGKLAAAEGGPAPSKKKAVSI